MDTDELSQAKHNARSHFIRKLIQYPSSSNITFSEYKQKTPKRIIQFWDRLDKLPHDVKECVNTWKKIEGQGFKRLLFDKYQARDFIFQNLGSRYLKAFDKCYHPAMMSDYFRLCYIFVEGGCYIDVDDVYLGGKIQNFFNDGKLKIQPLCYDTATSMMISPSLFTKAGVDSKSWIFYFNNNPLIACCRHPLIERALTQATYLLEKETYDVLPEIQSTTGPGNLSKSIFDMLSENTQMEHSLLVLSEWEDIVQSKWELSYRNDARNWRYSNCKKFEGHEFTK